jgi:hypothetical protein
MGSCLCFKTETDEGVIKTSNSKKQEFHQSNKSDTKKTSIEEDTTRTNNIQVKKVARKKSNKLSCDEYWDDIKKNTKVQNFLVKNDANKMLENKEDYEEPKIKTFKTNSNYGITIIEVNDVSINPNDVFYIQDKDYKKRPPSPRPITMDKKISFNKSLTVDIDKKITESIKNNTGFDQIYEDILSKHLCKK